MDIEMSQPHSHSDENKPKHIKNRVRTECQCQFCGKYLSSNSIKRHVSLCCASTVSIKKFNCNHCGKSFKRPDVLKRHGNSCLNPSSKKTKIPCGIDDCSVVCNFKTELFEHIVEKHQTSDIQPVEYMEFVSFGDFLTWKESEEHMTYSYFSKKTGSKRNVTYYYCQHDGSAKPHRKVTELNRPSKRRNLKGCIKTGKHCIAMLKVEECMGIFKVWYNPTHSHELNASDIRHQPISLHTSKYIEEQIALNTPLVDIVHNIHTMAEAVEMETDRVHKDTNVTVKNIREQCRKKNITLVHYDDVIKEEIVVTEDILFDDDDDDDDGEQTKLNLTESLTKSIHEKLEFFREQTEACKWNTHILCQLDAELDQVVKNVNASYSTTQPVSDLQLQ